MAPPSTPIPETLREVQGIFPSDAALQDAIGRLTRAGFDRAELSLPAASPTPAQATPAAGAANPNTEDDRRQARTLGSSTAAAAAAMLGAGITVATGGVAAAAAAAALGAGALAGGVVEGAHRLSDSAEAGTREAAAESGRLVLAVRARDAGAEAAIRREMEAAGASHVATVDRQGAAIV
jgi:hypothetical protein